MRIANDETQDNELSTIEKAIADTSELINYAARMGIAVEQKTLETLIRAKVEWEAGQWTPEVETNFWAAFNQISRDVKPATIASIKALFHKTRPRWGRFFSESYYVSTIYTILTLTVLLIVLVFQIYWVIGNSLSTKLTDLLTNEIELANGIIQADRDYASVEVRFKLLEAEEIDSQASGKYEFYNTPDWEREIAEIIVNRQKLENDLEALRTQLERNSKILLTWAYPWREPFLKENNVENAELAEQIKNLEEQITTAEQQLNPESVGKLIQDTEDQLEMWQEELEELDGKLVSLNDSSADSSSENKTLLEEEKAQIRNNIGETQEWLNQPNLVDIVMTQRKTELDKLKAEKAALERQKDREKTREEAHRVRLSTGFILIALQSYLLPVLYGLLGASVYVLRSIEQQTATVTFLPDNSHLLRLALGTIAGLIIGWFISLFPNQSLSIPSSALAFVAGYNIEFLFKQMDKVINPSRPDNATENNNHNTIDDDE